jgi:hypothetical protein
MNMAEQLKGVEERITAHVTAEIGKVTQRLDKLNGKVADHEKRFIDADLQRATRSLDCPNRDLIDALHLQSEKAEAVALASKDNSERQKNDIKVYVTVLAVVISLVNFLFRVI